MERSFARSVRFGFDRARWCGLSKLSIQEYLVSTIQNIHILISYIPNLKKTSNAFSYIKMTINNLKAPLCHVFMLIKNSFTVVYLIFIKYTQCDGWLNVMVGSM
jgi:hypothetical protein